MFHILGFLFIIIIAILLIGLSIIGSIFRSIFGLNGRRSSNTSPHGGGSYEPDGEGTFYNGQQSEQDEEATYQRGKSHPKRKKLFSEDEGEYVDFEEIKD